MVYCLNFNVHVDTCVSVELMWWHSVQWQHYRLSVHSKSGWGKRCKNVVRRSRRDVEEGGLVWRWEGKPPRVLSNGVRETWGEMDCRWLLVLHLWGFLFVYGANEKVVCVLEPCSLTSGILATLAEVLITFLFSPLLLSQIATVSPYI